ncbi:hypothetical protein [Sphingomonas sp. TDK1]|uniref:hypothetical protein n=1 Tax=Sphingomonas sp. TDK1 TaxID=453247 RepID=UPI0007D90936|nr:hypothetical protein [Sphingomonas sp. TDK1]OAN57194.1 hypothetical protein A7X12_08190 [Sphingomonas sp. TDK1]
MELLFALDLLWLGALFWTLASRRWEAALGALLALLGSLPILILLMGGAFRWSAAMLCVFTTLGGGLLVWSDVRGEGAG